MRGDEKCIRSSRWLPTCETRASMDLEQVWNEVMYLNNHIGNSGIDGPWTSVEWGYVLAEDMVQLSPLANMVINLVLHKNVCISSDKRLSTGRGHGPVEASTLANMVTNLLLLHTNFWTSSDYWLRFQRYAEHTLLSHDRASQTAKPAKKAPSRGGTRTTTRRHTTRRCRALVLLKE
jgi:hypothetical protein